MRHFREGARSTYSLYLAPRKGYYRDVGSQTRSLPPGERNVPHRSPPGYNCGPLRPTEARGFGAASLPGTIQRIRSTGSLPVSPVAEHPTTGQAGSPGSRALRRTRPHPAGAFPIGRFAVKITNSCVPRPVPFEQALRIDPE